MGIDTWTPRSIWQAVPMGINIHTTTRKVLHTISMHIRETVLYQHNHLTGEVALSLPLARMNGTRSEETITRKVSSLLAAFKDRAYQDYQWNGDGERPSMKASTNLQR